MFDPITLLAGIAPVIVEAGKAAINKWIVPDNFKPANITDYLSMKNSDLELFKAMNEAGGSNPSYPWVEAIVRLQRPLVVAVVLLTWAGVNLQVIPSLNADDVNNFAAAIGFYLFGDRTLFYTKKSAKNA
jgi:hypothetical protein